MANNMNRSSLLKSIGAIFVGLMFIIITSLATDVVLHATGIYPPWFQPMSNALFGLATAYRVIYSVIGCYITARLAPNRPLVHALILGGVGELISMAGAAATWNQVPALGPKWYPLALIVSALPSAFVGGKLRELQLQQNPNAGR